MTATSAAVVSLVFSGLAYFSRAVTPAGAATGALICFVICLGGGYSALGALVMVFLLTWISTRVGYQHKLKHGTAEKSDGRNSFQVVANLGVAASCSLLYLFTGKTAFLFALAAALSEAAADTVSSEAGQLSRSKPRLITTWREVPAGTDGGVTILGTLSGLAAAFAVTLVCVGGGLIPRSGAFISIAAALCGTFADSLLGASLERRKLLNNDLVNLIGTAVAALIAFIV